MTLCIYISSTNILGKQTKALEAEARGGVKTEAETPDGAGDTKASEAPFPPEPRRLVPKQPTYPPPGYKPVPQQPPAQPSVPQPKTPPSNHDLLQQQHMLAQHAAMREQAQKYSMHCMPQFTGPAALDMQETWLLQQQDIMRQQQTSFLIQQEQQHMDLDGAAEAVRVAAAGRAASAEADRSCCRNCCSSFFSEPRRAYAGGDEHPGEVSPRLPPGAGEAAARAEPQGGDGKNGAGKARAGKAGAGKAGAAKDAGRG